MLQDSKIGIEEYKSFLPQVFDKLDLVSDEYLDTYNEHKAFVYFVAELFETTEEGKFYYTDGPNDGNIDFFIKNSPIYSILFHMFIESEKTGEGDSEIYFTLQHSNPRFI